MILRAAVCLLFSSAVSLAAEGFVLSPPLDCDLTDDCYIQQYVDHDDGPGARDYRCAPLSYDGHKGTDFALPSLARMHDGVDVIAAAPGVVRGTRDGMADIGYSDATADSIQDRECGNGVVIAHLGGWVTQYCHMKQGSITRTRGEHVAAGDVLGQVGLSGRTQFPHVHLSVRQGDTVVDPFAPDAPAGTCDPSADTRTSRGTLWQTPPPYRPGGLISVGFADAIPSFDDVKSGAAQIAGIGADAPALVLYGYAFGGQENDTITLTLTGPDGVIVDQTLTLEKTQAQVFRAVGKKRRRDPWPDGAYTGTVTLLRDGAVIDRRSRDMTLP
ncbi:M23 family metallopeptidase [Sulfitobacter sabulilitoris]|uniref:M23 family metallopeptidase n=1 Tax=Sulfitobacter sabulilitoris TaxID=2562655 RepID=A0A5S3PM54_9RHOB|nr:M23 family metallopeptidase [Sulfitobacter sabulilitoris]TMM55479.1 M23 family metallopeptidase [Sulfitobacter sabulilitoris]